MANCSKYDRLYPERAVAPLRLLAERIRAEAARDRGHTAVVSEHSVDMALRDLDTLGFPPDEPLLLLRGQDELAPATVRFYADRVSGNLEAFDGQRSEVIKHLLGFAKRMKAWIPRKMPD